MRAPISGKQRNGKFVNGKLLRSNGKSYPTEYLEEGIERIAGDISPDESGDFQPTILKLRTVLAAAGIGSNVEGTNITISGLDRPSAFLYLHCPHLFPRSC